MVETEMSLTNFITTFVDNFGNFSQHTLEAWYLNSVKRAAFSTKYQPSSVLNCVSDFAQNLKVDKKEEVSEEYFHKTQIALFGTVTSITKQIRSEDGTITLKEKHTLSQITSSDNK